MAKVEDKRDEFIERVVKSLEEGVVPWRGPNLPTTSQRNAVSGRSYSGVNSLYLLEAAVMNDYADPRWITSTDAKTHGLKARAGEKSTSLEFWDKNEEGELTARTYPVFNMQQFYGAQTEKTEEYLKPDYAKAGAIFKEAGMELPPDSGKENYQEAVKNLIAATAEQSGVIKNIQSPQLKDLRMNLAGTFLMQEAGLPLDAPAEAPTKEWATTLRLNPKELFRATRDASKLVNEVLGRTKHREQNEQTAAFSQTEQPQTAQTQEGQERQEGQEKAFEPEIGQRVTFQPHEGKSKLTGTVKELNDHEVILQCGRATIPALREKGTFSEAPEPDRSHTKEYAKEQAQKYVGEQGNVFTARGEDAVYRGAVMELTPSFVIQKVGEDAILHRLKDLENTDKSLLQEGTDISISKGVKGEITVEPWSKEQEERTQEQSQEHDGR
jgi:antirestriction protein ArdC